MLWKETYPFFHERFKKTFFLIITPSSSFKAGWLWSVSLENRMSLRAHGFGLLGRGHTITIWTPEDNSIGGQAIIQDLRFWWCLSLRKSPAPVVTRSFLSFNLTSNFHLILIYFMHPLAIHSECNTLQQCSLFDQIYTSFRHINLNTLLSTHS